MVLYAATTNAGKLRDFAQTAAAHHIEVRPLPGLDAMPTPAEDAPDFMGNAVHKAVAYSRLAPGLLLLTDDSGLEVDALGGRPGVLSARFADTLDFEPNTSAGPATSKDARNNRCLLALLADINTATEGRAGRHARFRCALAVARDGRVLHRAEGTVEGEILQSPEGTGGFGYDPLFFIPRLGKTLAELDPAAKWHISHRGEAFRSLLTELQPTPA